MPNNNFEFLDQAGLDDMLVKLYDKLEKMYIHRSDLVDIAKHMNNAANPHNVTAIQIGAETIEGSQAKADQAEANAKAASRPNDWLPTTDDIGAASSYDLNTHVNNKSNPHEVTCEQIGAAPVSHLTDANAHSELFAPINASIADHANKIVRLEGFLYNEITGNPHDYAFDTLAGITVTSGNWNKTLARLEC